MAGAASRYADPASALARTPKGSLVPRSGGSDLVQNRHRAADFGHNPLADLGDLVIGQRALLRLGAGRRIERARA